MFEKLRQAWPSFGVEVDVACRKGVDHQRSDTCNRLGQGCCLQETGNDGPSK